MVIDDGLADTTAQILDSYGDRITVSRKQSGGVLGIGRNRNLGVNRGYGECIATLDHDDA
jgi:glycosyltransferase involved in cell wall biosynthesis